MSDVVLDFVASMRQHPELYIGSRSAQALILFLGGYAQAVRNHTKLSLARFEEFIEGLYEKYGRGDGGHSWAWVLGKVAGGDGLALDLFFEELEVFRQLHSS